MDRNSRNVHLKATLEVKSAVQLLPGEEAKRYIDTSQRYDSSTGKELRRLRDHRRLRLPGCAGDYERGKMRAHIQSERVHFAFCKLFGLAKMHCPLGIMKEWPEI
jgi:hypothetical protein